MHLIATNIDQHLKNRVRYADIRLHLEGAYAPAPEIIHGNPVSKVKSLKAESASRSTFSLPQLKRILEVADDEWRGIILAGLYTGQRLRDVATLTWGAINRDREELTLITSKTGRTIIIPIASPLLDYLKQRPTLVEVIVRKRPTRRHLDTLRSHFLRCCSLSQ